MVDEQTSSSATPWWMALARAQNGGNEPAIRIELEETGEPIEPGLSETTEIKSRRAIPYFSKRRKTKCRKVDPSH